VFLMWAGIRGLYYFTEAAMFINECLA